MAGIDHIAIEVSDMDTSSDFCVSVLGFTLKSRAVNEDEHEEYSFLELEGFHLELIRDGREDNFGTFEWPNVSDLRELVAGSRV